MKTVLLFISMILPSLALAGAYEDMEEAMIRRDPTAVIALLDRGMDLNTVDRAGDTLLIQAVRGDMPELIDYLLQRRARLNNRNRNGETALSIAAFTGKMPYVQRLIEAGAEVNFYGWPPLSYAAFNGHREVVEYLIKRGADINARAENGATPLYLAARNGHAEIVRVLLEHEADPAIVNQRNETPVDAAMNNANREIEDMLRAAGGRSGKAAAIEVVE